MQYKVPQNVQREDTILWFITMRQFLILLIGGGISYLLYSSFGRNNDLNGVQLALICIPAILALTISFLKIKGISFVQFILFGIENAFFRAHRRFWIQGTGEPFVSRTSSFKDKKNKKDAPEVSHKDHASSQKIKNLADMLDHRTPPAQEKAAT